MLQNQIYHNMNIWNKNIIYKKVSSTKELLTFLNIKAYTPILTIYPDRVYCNNAKKSNILKEQNF